MARTIDVKLINAFFSAAVETMQAMGSVQVTRRNLFLKTHNKMLGDLYAVIGLSDGMVGNCGISLSKRLAEQMCEHVFGVAVEEEALLLDAVGELVNLIAGGGRCRLVAEQNGYRFQISPPTILINHDTQAMEVYNPAGTECVVVECGLNDFEDSLMIELALVPKQQ